jgi:hypothetical protein
MALPPAAGLAGPLGVIYGPYWALYGQNGSGPYPGWARTVAENAGIRTKPAASSQEPSLLPRCDPISGLPGHAPVDLAPTGRRDTVKKTARPTIDPSLNCINRGSVKAIG